MTSPGSSRVRSLAGALTQVAAGLAAHALAAGCLPPASALALSVPAAVLGVLVVGALLHHQPLRTLAAGQLTVHACLSASACAVGTLPPEAATHGAPSLLMTAAHVGALVVCRATGGAVLRGADAAVAALVHLVRPLEPAPQLRVPRVGRPVPTALPVRPCRGSRHARPPRRGPPPVPPRLVPA